MIDTAPHPVPCTEEAEPHRGTYLPEVTVYKGWDQDSETFVGFQSPGLPVWPRAHHAAAPVFNKALNETSLPQPHQCGS